MYDKIKRKKEIYKKKEKENNLLLLNRNLYLLQFQYLHFYTP
tara:strand:+ start:210 stop:335 length:126 start_codon:yes stop_codon:yes gene_type:complete